MITHKNVRGRAMLATAGAMTITAFAAPATSAGQEATASRIKASARQDIRRGELAKVRGKVGPRRAGRTVVLQARRKSGWGTVDRVKTRRGGRFSAMWRPKGVGSYDLRVRTGTTNRPVTRRIRGGVNVLRPAQASWYGGGGALACGGQLSSGTLGVANKTLPCGSRVRLNYRGRSVTVRVIDRGPFAGNREFDLTAATKRRLHFGDVGVVWASR